MYKSYLKLEHLIQTVVINGAEETHHLEIVMSKEIWVEMLKKNKFHRGTLVIVNHIQTPSNVDKDPHNILHIVKCNKEKNSLQLPSPTHMVTMVNPNIDIHLHLLQVPMMWKPSLDLWIPMLVNIKFNMVPKEMKTLMGMRITTLPWIVVDIPFGGD